MSSPKSKEKKHLIEFISDIILSLQQNYKKNNWHLIVISK